MDERQLKEILEADDVPAADENARKRAMNLALGAFDDAQRNKEKNRQGVGLLGRLIGRSNNRSGRRPMKKWHLIGGTATAMTVVLAVVTYDVAKDRGLFFHDGIQRQSEKSAGGEAKSQTEVERNIAQVPQPSEQAPVSVDKKMRERFAKDELRAETDRPVQPPVARSNKPKAAPPPVAAILQSPPRHSAQGAASGAKVDRLQERSAFIKKSVGQRKLRRADDASGRYYKDVGRDQFQQIAENEIKRVGDAPVSTFSVDVDTASYSFMRRQLNRGVLPQKNAVRVEELVNYFDYAYPLPASRERPFHASVSVTPSPWKKGNKLIHIGIKGYDIDADVKPRSNLVFLLDVSGSMKENNKLEIVKDALEVLVDELDRADRVSIVAYTDEAWVALDTTDGGDKDRIIGALRELRPMRSTNAEAGLILGYDLADDNYDRESQNRVILLSDGVANVGRTGPEGILARISGETSRGIDLVTIGVGIHNYNDALLEQLADQGDGFYAYVDTRDEAERLFRDQLTSTLETVARDVKVQVRFDPDVVAEYRLLGFENRDIRDDDFRNDSVDAGEIGAGHSVVALYEVELDEEAYGRRAPAFAEVSLRWEDADTGRVDEISGEVYAEALATSFGRTEPEFQLAATVAAYAEVLRGSRYMRGISLDEIADAANELPLRQLGSDADEFIELVERAERIAH